MLIDCQELSLSVQFRTDSVAVISTAAVVERQVGKLVSLDRREIFRLPTCVMRLAINNGSLRTRHLIIKLDT